MSDHFQLLAISLYPTDGLKEVPKIIAAAAKSPLGVLALIILVLAVLAVIFFKTANDNVRVSIFVLMFFGFGLFGWAMINANSAKSDTNILDHPSSSVTRSLTLAGTVVDSQSNGSISGAEVTIVGHEDRGVSDSTGNFRFEVHGLITDIATPVDMRVTKDGYQTLDWQVVLPQRGLTIPLHLKAR